MNDSIIRYTGLVAASVAIASIFSTLIGRVYFLSYYKTLAVPISEVSVNISDYAVMSLDVTIYGIGIAVAVSLIVTLGRQTPSPDRRRIGMLVGAIAVLIIPLVCLWVASVWLERPPLDFPGGFGLLGAIMAFLWIVVSPTLFWSGIPRNFLSLVRGKSKGSRNCHISMPLSPFLYPVAMVLLVLAGSMASADMMGKTDAQAELEYAPAIEIEFAESASDSATQIELAECSKDFPQCAVKLVWTGERFVYVSTGEALYAVPHTRIDSIILNTGNP